MTCNKCYNEHHDQCMEQAGMFSCGCDCLKKWFDIIWFIENQFSTILTYWIKNIKKKMELFLMIKKKCDRCGSFLGVESQKTKQRFCGNCKKKFKLYPNQWY